MTVAILSVVVLVLAIQLSLGGLHRRSIEEVVIQAIDTGRRAGIDHYRESWASAQKDFDEQMEGFIDESQQQTTVLASSMILGGNVAVFPARGCFLEGVWMVRFALVSLVALCFLQGVGYGQTGARAFAARLNASGGLYHDPGFSGPEVVYRSHGFAATRENAWLAWQQSRAGHAELVNSGQITDVQCVGEVCVGRGVGPVTATAVKARRAAVAPLRLFGRLFRR